MYNNNIIKYESNTQEVLDTQSSQQYSILLANVYTQVCADIPGYKWCTRQYYMIESILVQNNYYIYLYNNAKYQSYLEFPWEEDKGVVVDVVGMFAGAPTPKLYKDRM